MIATVEQVAEHTASTTVPPARRPNGGLVLAVGAGLVLVTGLAIVLALSQWETGSTIVVTPLSPAAPASAPEVAQPAAVAASPPAAVPTAAVVAEADTVETGPVVEHEPAVEIAPAIEQDPAVAIEPPRSRARAAPRVRPEPEGTGMRSAAPRRGTLRGLDQFERELGN